MRRSALAALVAVSVAGCSQQPVEAPQSAPDAPASDDALAATPERVEALDAALLDARERLLPSLEDAAPLSRALDDLDLALASGHAARVRAASTAALQAVESVAATHPESSADLDAIRLALGEVAMSASGQTDASVVAP